MKVRFVDLDDKFTYNSDIGILDQWGVRRHLTLVQPLIRYLLETLFILERWNWKPNLLLFWEEKNKTNNPFLSWEEKTKTLTHFYLGKKKEKNWAIKLIN